jgi:lysophospholipase L1-like esterase
MEEPLLFGLTGQRATVVLFGDSLTQRGWGSTSSSSSSSSSFTSGWVSSVSNIHPRKIDVFNRGFGGYNTRWAKVALPHLFPLMASSTPADQQPRHLLVTVWFGANDAALPSERAHVPLVEYEANLRAIVAHAKRSALHVVVLTPPPVHAPTRLAYQRAAHGAAAATGVLERTTELAASYAAAAARVADAEHVALLDVCGLMLSSARSGGRSGRSGSGGSHGWPAFVGGAADGSAGDGDGLHLSASGQAFVAAKLLELLSYSSASPSSLLESPDAAVGAYDSNHNNNINADEIVVDDYGRHLQDLAASSSSSSSSFSSSSSSSPSPAAVAAVAQRFRRSQTMLRGFRDLLERLPAELPYGADVDARNYADSMVEHQRRARRLVGATTVADGGAGGGGERGRDERGSGGFGDGGGSRGEGWERRSYTPPSGNGHLPELHASIHGGDRGRGGSGGGGGGGGGVGGVAYGALVGGVAFIAGIVASSWLRSRRGANKARQV